MQDPPLTVGLATGELETQLESHRRELTAYCYRMLGSPFEAEDAVQDTFIRAWRALDRFEGRAALRSWLYRIATNVCLDMLHGRERRAPPMDLGPAREPIEANLNIAARGDVAPADPRRPRRGRRRSRPTSRSRASRSGSRSSRALQQLPPRQRAVLILCEVLRWKASEVAELLDTSVASVNSALQRARATLEASEANAATPTAPLDDADRALLERYVEAFEALRHRRADRR